MKTVKRTWRGLSKLRSQDTRRGAGALEYLIRAERFVDDTKIAKYISEDYKDHFCATDDRLVKSNEASAALCLTDDYAYFTMLSPLLSEGRVLGYDKLVFDLTNQMRMLGTDTIHLKLVYQDECKDLFSGASIIHNNDISALFYKEGFYYQAFKMLDNTYFISKQSEGSLFEQVHRLSKQTLLLGIGVLFGFAATVYFLVIRFAAKELVNLEDSRRSLKEAVTEANIDPLTDVANRRAGEEFLTLAFEGFRRGEPSPAMVMFDIDCLKHINDTYGHSGGDQVIRSIAKAVQENIRSDDMLLRWGGDEFIGIFRDLSKENTMTFARKLLKAVSDLTVVIDEGTINPTISIGVSYFDEGDGSFLEEINRADRAMYKAKAEGRNRAHEL